MSVRATPESRDVSVTAQGGPHARRPCTPSRTRTRRPGRSLALPGPGTGRGPPPQHRPGDARRHGTRYERSLAIRGGAGRHRLGHASLPSAGAAIGTGRTRRAQCHTARGLCLRAFQAGWHRPHAAFLSRPERSPLRPCRLGHAALCHVAAGLPCHPRLVGCRDLRHARCAVAQCRPGQFHDPAVARRRLALELSADEPGSDRGHARHGGRQPCPRPAVFRRRPDRTRRRHAACAA